MRVQSPLLLIISFCCSADPSPSWEWEWSSWALFFSSSFSWCKTRQKWTLCFTVHHQKRTSVCHGRRLLVCFIVSLAFSVCRVLLHLHGGSDQRSGARRLHLWLHGLLYKDGNKKSSRCTTATSKWFMYQTALFLRQGEPHLSNSYAVMMSYWEGVVHHALFFTIIHRMFTGYASSPACHVFTQQAH